MAFPFSPLEMISKKRTYYHLGCNNYNFHTASFSYKPLSKGLFLPIKTGIVLEKILWIFIFASKKLPSKKQR